MAAFQGKKSGYSTLSEVPAKYGRACVAIITGLIAALGGIATALIETVLKK